MKSILDFQKMRDSGKKISMLTCYDYSFARIVSESEIDCILVGDSLAMTMHGYADTLPATDDWMAWHTAAVKKGAPEKMIVTDLPFLAHRGSLNACLKSIRKVMLAGASAIKLEGVDGSEKRISHIVQSGVPVMGHLGLTPQSINQFGGFKVQATNEVAAKKILAQAKRLQEIGCFSLVLECVPSEVAKEITGSISIPTIGIGAGPNCSGQVLVLQDLLGMNAGFRPRFVRPFFSGAESMKLAFNQFNDSVKNGNFPNSTESY